MLCNHNKPVIEFSSIIIWLPHFSQTDSDKQLMAKNCFILQILMAVINQNFRLTLSIMNSANVGKCIQKRKCIFIINFITRSVVKVRKSFSMSIIIPAKIHKQSRIFTHSMYDLCYT